MANVKDGIVNYILKRERGVHQQKTRKSEDVALRIGEEKATLPVQNQPCELSGQSRSTFLMAFSPDGNKIASTHGDHTVRVTDIRTGRCTHILTGHPRTPWCIAFHPTSNDILASGCLGGEVRIWDLHGGGSEVWKSTSGFVISSLAFHPVDQVLVFAQGNEVHFWDWRDSKPFTHCKTANDYEKVRWVKFDVWGHHLYTGIANGSTVQRNDSLDEFSYISVPQMNTSERRRLREQYNMLVNRMASSQRMRVNPQGLSNTQSEIELVEPRSPTHGNFNTQGLTDAVRYAGEVTSRRRALRNAREYAAHVTSTTLQENSQRIGGSRNSERYQDGRRSEADSDTLIRPSQTYSIPPPSGFFDLSSRQPCQPPASSGESTDQQPALAQSANSSDGAIRNVLLPDLMGPTAVSSANTARRTSSQSRPPLGSSLLRSRLCASAASSPSGSSGSEGITSAAGAALTSAAPAMSMSGAESATSGGASLTAASLPEIVAARSPSLLSGNSATATVASAAAVSSSSERQSSRPPPTATTGRHSLLRSFLSFPSATSAPASATVSSPIVTTSSVNQSSIVNQSSTSAAPVIIYNSTRTPSSSLSTPGRFNFSQVSSTAQSVSSSLENAEPISVSRRLDRPVSETRLSSEGDRSSPESEPGSSCPDQCNICSGLPGTQESLALHRMRNRRRRMMMRNSLLGRRSLRRTGNPPSHSTTPQRERTQTLASYIDSEVRRVLGQQNSQESDSVDSTEERADSYREPTALIMPTGRDSANTAPSTETNSTISADSDTLVERRRHLYERLRNDVRDMENDMRDLRNVMRERHAVIRMQNLARYRQRREDRQRRIDERLQLSGRQTGRGRTGPRLSRFQNLGARTAEIQRRNRIHMGELRAGYRASLRDAHRQIPEITVTQASPESEDTPNPLTRTRGQVLSQLRRFQEERNGDSSRNESRSWHSISRSNLHQHYSTSILDDTINRPEDGLHAAINRAIAGAFMGTGEAAVASNIVSLTHRIQRWDFTKAKLPDITDNEANVIVGHCKLHNDASVDLAQDGSLIAVLVPSARAFPNDTIMAVFSLTEDTLGQCLYTKSFGPNAISVSISPLNNYVLIGLAAKRLQWVFTPKQMVAQVFKMKTKEAGEDSMEHICDLMHPCDLDIRTHVSVNSARWLPGVGEGIIYGTNRGDLHICRPGDDEKDRKDRPPATDNSDSNNIRRNLMQMLGIAVPDTTSTATQTVHRIRRTASTQTDGAANQHGAAHSNPPRNGSGFWF